MVLKVKPDLYYSFVVKIMNILYRMCEKAAKVERY